MTMAAIPSSDSCSAAYWEHIYRSSPASLDYDGWLDAVDLPSGAAVLDLGCGAGADTLALLRRGMHVTAADFSQSAVNLLRKRLSSSLASADCFDMRQGLPYPDQSFDAVLADLSLHYFSWADTARIVADIYRILRSGGRLIARVHSLRNLPPNAEATLERIEERFYHVNGTPRRYFTPEDIRSLFAQWQLASLCETAIRRYGLDKQVITFIAEKS